LRLKCKRREKEKKGETKRETKLCGKKDERN
jgi:hypothetical protein